MAQNRILFCIIENEGGMSDVAAAYLDFFSHNKVEHVLLILTERPERRRRQFKNLEKKNIYFVYFKNLFFLSYDIIQRREAKIAKILKAHKISVVVCDYMGFVFFRDKNLKIIADIHYLLSSSNKIATHFPSSNSKESFQFIAKDIQDLSFRRSLLVKQRVEQELIRTSELILVNSNATRRDVLSSYGSQVKKAAIRVCPVAKVLSPVGPVTRYHKKKRAFLYHGRINSIKGVQFLPEIAERLKLPTQVIGANRLQRAMFPRQKTKNLKFMPWTKDEKTLLKYLNSSAFHLFPSFYEPWGLALTKSLEVGAICIANKRSGGHREQINHGENGFLVDFSKRDSLKRISEIINSPSPVLAKISKGARRSARDLISSRRHEYVLMVIDIVRHNRD